MIVPLLGLYDMIAVVTGGSRGIGEAVARKFVSHGIHTLIVGRDELTLQQTCQKIAAASKAARIAYFPCQVQSEADVLAMFEYCKTNFGTPNILVNNAGVIKVNRFTEVSADEWDEVHNINLKGTFLCSKEAYKGMIELGGGCIVNISSLGGIRATEKFPGFVSYCSSKAAIIGFTEALAREGKEHNIRVNCVAPGAVRTQMLAQAAPRLETKVFPEHIAKTIYMLSDEAQSSHLSGSTIEVFSNEP